MLSPKFGAITPLAAQASGRSQSLVLVSHRSRFLDREQPILVCSKKVTSQNQGGLFRLWGTGTFWGHLPMWTLRCRRDEAGFGAPGLYVDICLTFFSMQWQTTCLLPMGSSRWAGVVPGSLWHLPEVARWSGDSVQGSVTHQQP